MSEILSTNGQVIIVDDEDFEIVSSRGNWMAVTKHKVVYAVRNEYGGRVNGKAKTRRIYLHHLLIDHNGGHIDHINGNGLDNRRVNLRAVTPLENQRNRGKQTNNTSGYKGVYYHKQRGKWAASIRHLGRNMSLGLYLTPEDAGAAYVAKVSEIWQGNPRAMLDAAPKVTE